MAEAKPIPKPTQPPPRIPPAPPAPPAPPVPPVPTTTGDLARIIQELQKRLAGVEKRQMTGIRKRKSDASPDAAQPPAAAPAKASASAALEVRLQDFRDLEQALHLEELALHTRAKAAAQEELLLQHESRTLQLKMKSFRAATLRLREQESQLEQGLATLNHERRKLEEVRHELDAARQQLEADRAAMNEQSVHEPKEPEEPEGGWGWRLCASPGPVATFRMVRTISLAALALAAIVSLCIALAWLTIDPIYRADATVKGLSIDPTASNADHATWLTDATLQRSMTTLQQRGLRPFSSVETMRQAIREHLTLSSNEEGSTEFAYESRHRDQAVLTLDALVRSLVQPDGAAPPRTGGTGGTGGLTITRAAAAALDPVHDGRPRAAMAYLLLATCIIAAIVTLRRKMRQS